MVKWDINIYASHIRTYQIEIVSDISYGFLKNGYPKPIGFPIKSYQCSANVEIPGTLWRALIEKWSFTILRGDLFSIFAGMTIYIYLLRVEAWQCSISTEIAHINLNGKASPVFVYQTWVQLKPSNVWTEHGPFLLYQQQIKTDDFPSLKLPVGVSHFPYFLLLQSSHESP